MSLTSNNQISDSVLLLTIFISGACVLIIELMGTRILAPFFGSGVYTWSALIAVTLAALALGYALGGRLADNKPSAVILFGLCLLAGAWTLATPFFAQFLLPSTAQFSDIRLGVLLSSVVLFSPNLFLLGAMGPFVIRLVTASNEVVGSRSGLVFSISTIGSLLGALGTGFYLVPNYGVQTIFLVCGVTLIILSGAGFLYTHSRLAFLSVVGLAIGMIDTSSTPPSSIKVLAQTPSFFGQLQVVEKNQLRVLITDGVGQNYVNENNIYNSPYLNFLSSVVQARQKNIGKTSKNLIIGVGAGHLPTIFQKENIDSDVVELDPKVIALARQYFDFKMPDNKIHIGDGRLYLSHTSRVYDSIVIDAFSSDQIAAHLLSKEALESAKSRLSDGGIVGVNVTSIIAGKDIAAINQTLRAVFDYVRVFSPTGKTDTLTSIIFLASSRPIEIDIESSSLKFQQTVDYHKFVDGEVYGLSDGVMVTDDFNPLEYYRLPAQSLWRKAMLGYFGSENTEWLLF